MRTLLPTLFTNFNLQYKKLRYAISWVAFTQIKPFQIAVKTALH